MLCTTRAGAHKLLAKGCARTVHADPCIRGREALLLCKVLQPLLAKIDGSKNRRVLRLEPIEDAVEAGADFVVELRRWLRCSLQLTCPRLKRFILGRVSPIGIDYSIAEQAVEPGHGRLIRIEVALMFKGAQIGGLKNVFCQRCVRDTALHKGQELPALSEECIERCIRHEGLRGR